MDFFTAIINGLDVSDTTGSSNGIGDSFSQMLTDLTDNFNDILTDVVGGGEGEESDNIFMDIFNEDTNDGSSSNFSMSGSDAWFLFAVADIENSHDTCDLLDQIEADFNSLMALADADPAKIFDPLFADNNEETTMNNNEEDGEEDGIDNLFEGIGEFFSTAADIFTNTIDMVVNVVSYTSPRCSDSDDAMLREVFADFTKCSNVDMTLDEFFKNLNMDVFNTGFTCIDQIFPEVAAVSNGDRRLMKSENPSLFCSTNENGFQSDCTSDIMGENVIGELFRMMLVTPDTTCSCLSILDRLPECRTSFSNGAFADGGRMKKYKCLLESSTCPFLASACDDRLDTLDTCLPSLDTFRTMDLDDNTDSSPIDCKEVMCGCEAVENDQSINYAAQLMELPLTDMCQQEAETSTDSIYGDVPQRYELLRSMCGYTSADIFDNFYAEESPHQQQEQPATVVEEEEEVATQEEEKEVVVVEEEEKEVEEQPFGVLPSEEVVEEVTAVAVVEPFEEITSTVVFSSAKYDNQADKKDGNLVGIFIGCIAAIFIMAIVIVVFFVVFKKKNSADNTKEIHYHPEPPVDDIRIIKPSNTQETSDFFTDDESSKASVAKTELTTP